MVHVHYIEYGVQYIERCAYFEQDSGELLWIYDTCKPIFSSLSLIPSGYDASPSPSISDASPSPSISDDRIVFACVDGHVCLLSSSDGAKVSVHGMLILNSVNW